MKILCHNTLEETAYRGKRDADISFYKSNIYLLKQAQMKTKSETFLIPSELLYHHFWGLKKNNSHDRLTKFEKQYGIIFLRMDLIWIIY